MRYTPSGKPVTDFSVAVNRQYAAANGETVKETIWFKITTWGRQAEVCNEHLKKGASVLIEGRLQIRSYEASDGQKRRVAEVIAQTMEFLERKQPSEDNKEPGGANPFGGQVMPEEEIPF